MTVNSPLRIESQKFLKLAIPLASAQVAQSLTGFFDTIMMGRLSAENIGWWWFGFSNFFLPSSIRLRGWLWELAP